MYIVRIFFYKAVYSVILKRSHLSPSGTDEKLTILPDEGCGNDKATE